MNKIMLVVALGALGASGFAGIAVDDKLPAGNIIVDGIEGDVVKVRQDQRGTVGEKWFYWAMRVTGAAGRTVKFEFDGNPGGGPVGVRGPVVSLDRGKTFSYPLDGKSRADGFTYAFPKGADEVWFYECHPYVRADWDAFVASHKDKLGRASRSGRSASRGRVRTCRSPASAAFGRRRSTASSCAHAITAASRWGAGSWRASWTRSSRRMSSGPGFARTSSSCWCR